MGKTFSLEKILETAIKGDASDVHIRAGMTPIFRVQGELLPVKGAQKFAPDQVEKMARALMTDAEWEKFEKTNDVDTSFGIEGVGRFRINVFRQRGSVGLVFRVIPFSVDSIQELNLPSIITDLADERRGLILVTGATGSGKSSTLAAMLSHINKTRTEHIVTLEDPIEYLLEDRKSIITQREVGTDTEDFAVGVRAALRQDPDVIMIGEMRDFETIEIALTAAETGHLVLSTLHTTEAAEAVNRIVTAFPPHLRDQARYQFGNLFKGVISQRLIPRADAKGLIPATEVMLATGRIKELVEEGVNTKTLTDAIAEGNQAHDMMTFDQSLMELVENDKITYEEALKHTTNPEDFELKASGIGSTSDASW
jgi:twitching motility protein PilT